MYWALLEYVATSGVDAAALAEHLRICVSGGAPMPADVLRRFEATFGVHVLEGYGLSETSPVVCFNQLQKPTKPGTVGMPIFGVDVRCVDEEGMPVGTGERGEIVVRGPNVMKGYCNRPDATVDVMRNGWFHTGDIGVLDADGYLSIVDRKKDMILRGGFNVYPRDRRSGDDAPRDLTRRGHRGGGPTARRGSQGVRRQEARTELTEIIKETVNQSQILMITHNKKTMEIADSLFGVTMQKQGISTLVSVNLA